MILRYQALQNVEVGLAPLQHNKWVVYAKAPFGGPQHVLEYLGRYTHRVAISNRRLLSLHDGQVAFEWKDYRDAGKSKVSIFSIIRGGARKVAKGPSLGILHEFTQYEEDFSGHSSGIRLR